MAYTGNIKQTATIIMQFLVQKMEQTSSSCIEMHRKCYEVYKNMEISFYLLLMCKIKEIEHIWDGSFDDNFNRIKV